MFSTSCGGLTRTSSPFGTSTHSPRTLKNSIPATGTGATKSGSNCRCYATWGLWSSSGGAGTAACCRGGSRTALPTRPRGTADEGGSRTAPTKHYEISRSLQHPHLPTVSCRYIVDVGLHAGGTVREPPRRNITKHPVRFNTLIFPPFPVDILWTLDYTLAGRFSNRPPHATAWGCG
jgi:hypothetical protein